MEFFTRVEKERLEAQHRELTGRRKEITERISEARALGDLKENAEYHSAREEQGLNERKIRELEETLANGQLADDIDVPEDMVFLGAKVRLREIEADDEDIYKLVGTASGDFSVDYVEVTSSSPMGQALLKARVGETVRVDLPKGAANFEILEIL